MLGDFFDTLFEQHVHVGHRDGDADLHVFLDLAVFRGCQGSGLLEDDVVDTDLAVHGFPTLHVVSSSVFPTSGQANSTFMIVVFGVFAFSRVLAVQFIGFGLAVAVLLDATLIRMVLVPAIMHIAGRWNWWPGVRAPKLGPGDAT